MIMSIRLRWLGSGSFEIVLPSGKVLVTNPYFGHIDGLKAQEVTGADYITVTHDSYIALGELHTLAQRFNSKVICNHYVGEALTSRPYAEHFFEIERGDVIRVQAGDTVVLDDLKIEVKKGSVFSGRQSARIAYEVLTGEKPSPTMSLAELNKDVPIVLSPETVEMIKHLKEVGLCSLRGGLLNYVFQTSDNLRIYHYVANHIDFLRDEIVKARPNIFIAPMGGNPEKLAEFAALSGAEVIILSTHTVRGAEVKRLLTQRIADYLKANSTAYFVEDIVPGKWYEIGIKMSAI